MNVVSSQSRNPIAVSPAGGVCIVLKSSSNRNHRNLKMRSLYRSITTTMLTLFHIQKKELLCSRRHSIPLSPQTIVFLSAKFSLHFKAFGNNTTIIMSSHQRRIHVNPKSRRHSDGQTSRETDRARSRLQHPSSASYRSRCRARPL